MPTKKQSETIIDDTKVIIDQNLNVDNSIGPRLYERDENGLLKNVQYIFNDDGSVNWRGMIKSEYLFPNRGWFESRGKDCPKNIEGLEDHQLLIKLGGIKDLAKLRGFREVSYKFEKCEEHHVAVICKINFSPNYETFHSEVYFEDSANATTNNTGSFATKFLETIACNRAFVRCVRNFLNIHIVGDDEIDKSSKLENSQDSSISIGPIAVLRKSLSSKFKIEEFSEFKEKLRELWSRDLYKNESVKDWNDFSDIPAKEARILLNIVSKI